MVPSACNYNPNATSDCSQVEGGSNTNCCTSGSTTATECGLDMDNDGFQDYGTETIVLASGNCGCETLGYGWEDQSNLGEQVWGCTNPICPEYSPLATHDNGSCCLGFSGDSTTTEFELIGSYIVDNSDCLEEWPGDYDEEYFAYLGWVGQYYEELLRIYEYAYYMAPHMHMPQYDNPIECAEYAGDANWFCGNQIPDPDSYTPCEDECFELSCIERPECSWESPECRWDASQWGGDACFQEENQQSQAACEADLGCQWDYQGGWCFKEQGADCFSPSMQNEAVCQANADCEWWVPPGYDPLDCPVGDPGVCNFYDWCHDYYCWEGECDQAGCNNDSYCRWHDQPGQPASCVEDAQAQYCECYVELSESSCQAAGFIWNVELDNCTIAVDEMECYAGGILYDCDEDNQQWINWNQEDGVCEIIIEDSTEGTWELVGEDILCIEVNDNLALESCVNFSYEECQCNFYRCNWTPQPTNEYPDAGTCSEDTMYPGEGRSRPSETCLPFESMGNGVIHFTLMTNNGSTCTVIFLDESVDYCDEDGNVLDCFGVCGGYAVLDVCGNCHIPPGGEVDVTECSGSGCMDVTACNYNVMSIYDCNNCCVYVDDNYDCNGNCTAGVDCLGVCGGATIEDECGVCGGNGSSCADCANVPNGDSLLDNCGTCDNDPSNDCVPDCAGEWGGTAADDCAGVCGGNAAEDNCGTCDSDSSNNCVQDCAGVWGGLLFIDCTGECGILVIDECGVCGGNGWDGCDDDGNGINNKEQYGYGAYGLSAIDIPNDQGGYLYLSFNKSVFDTDTLTTVVPENWEDSGIEGYFIERLDNGIWTNITSSSAYGEDSYQVEARTLADSTSISNALTEYRVIAAMFEGSFVSMETAIGYSLDNIAPETPESFSGVYDENNAVLSWNPSDANDLSHYNIYRNAALHSTTTETSFTDEITADTEYAVSAVDIHENESDMSASILVSMPLNIIDNLIPTKYELMTAYPNPFNPITNITYGLPEYTNVQIVIFDLSGKQIESLINEFQSPGYYSINWNADNHPSGIYFVTMIAGEYVNTQKLMLVK